MTLNHEVFVEDPTEHEIPNLGVAKVLIPESDEELAILRWELTHFVCEGEYERGLQRILDSYLRNLDKDAQPAAWVSGFFGSGKSHLVRVLQYLWTDFTFPDGSTAQGLTKLPPSVSQPLKELRTFGKREGGLWAAAGKLGAGAGDSVRLAFLGIILRATGLPERVEPAQFVLWLYREGLLDKVRSEVEAAGRIWSKELRNLYVSPAIANALLAGQSGFASSPAEAKSLVKNQFPPVTDVSDEEFLEVLRGVLDLQSQKEGRTPATLIVLDELQQYINDDAERMLDVQNVVEACSTKFESRVLVVSTGQSALQATPVLQKLQDRYSVRVPLADADIDSVVRRVVLQKRPDKVGELQAKLDQVSGEISRHLAGSKIAPVGEDADDIVPLYPILPTRQRFWRRVLGAIDPGGTAGQLRTQLQTVHEATQAAAVEPIGTVVAADFVYDQQAAGMLETGVMPRETFDEIASLRDGSEQGDLRSRIAALAFLISKVPTDAGSDIGVRANAEMLADLLVEELDAPSTDLRKQVAAQLEAMAKEGLLNEVDGEYRLLTKESANWQAEYQKRLGSLLSDSGRIASDRDSALKGAVSEVLRRVAPLHGKSKTVRKLQFSYGETEPADDRVSIPVWIRDGWETTEKSVRDHSAKAGINSPLITVFIPRQEDEALRNVLAERAAASDTLTGRPMPTTSEGSDARAGMEARKTAAESRLQTLVTQIMRGTKVFQGGGNELAGSGLEESATEAADASLDRRFPQFSAADHSDWGKVVQRSREGSAEPLAPVDDSGEVTQNPVCKEVLQYLPGSWTKGSDIRRHFAQAPYGWPQDAADGALVALVGAGALGARLNGQDVPVKNLNPGSVSKTEFRKEVTTVTTKMKVAVRGLLAEFGFKAEPGEEAAFLTPYFDRLLERAKSAGGEPPLPEPPDTSTIKKIRHLSGNELISEVYKNRDQLKDWGSSWERASNLATERREAWDRLQDLIHFAEGLPAATLTAEQIQAITAERRLLDEPDPIGPSATTLCDSLREALLAAYAQYDTAFKSGRSGLEADPQWALVDETKRGEILAAVGLISAPSPPVGTESELLVSLREAAISEWIDRAQAIPMKVAQARERAAKELAPKAQRFSPPPAHLTSHDEVRIYVEDLKEELLSRIEEGPVII